MAPLAMRFPRVQHVGAISPTDIFNRGNYLHVCWVGALAVLAKVVNGHIVGNSADKLSVNDAVNAKVLAMCTTFADNPISIGGSTSGPIPTLIGIATFNPCP